jgi:ribosomal protein L3
LIDGLIDGSIAGESRAGIAIKPALKTPATKE